MNLAKLFETQKVLRNRINYDGADRFEKLILALLVELGECANEWRGFKFWSKNQEPRNKDIICHACKGQGYFAFPNQEEEDCAYCEGSGYQDKNPLLEEYVDCLHFILEIGIEVEIQSFGFGMDEYKAIYDQVEHENNIVVQFLRVKQFAFMSFPFTDAREWYQLFVNFKRLGEMLGFTWEEIEQAYYAKNQINHERQNNGY